MPLHVIVNADDLGISVSVNDAIFELMGDGWITSATIMANGPAVNHALERLPKFPQCSFGIHCNLTQFESLSGDVRLGPLLNSAGEFKGNRRFHSIDLRLLQGIAAEASAQIEFLLAKGVKLTHFDSHHYIHTAPIFFPVLKSLQLQYGIRRVRASLDLCPGGKKLTGSLLLKKNLWKLALRYVVPTFVADHLGTLEAVISSLDGLRDGRVVEAMVHPGNSGFARENKLIPSRWWEETAHRVHLIPYDFLSRSPV